MSRSTSSTRTACGQHICREGTEGRGLLRHSGLNWDFVERFSSTMLPACGQLRAENGGEFASDGRRSAWKSFCSNTRSNGAMVLASLLAMGHVRVTVSAKVEREL